MPKKITNVEWSASNVPSGLSFDTQTGTFSGTPSESGEYTIPVKVTTNYGSDQKDVKLISSKAYPVYAIGSKAATWSENAEADANGFRKLNMPNAYKLIFGQNGFGAKCTDGNYYACGHYNVVGTYTTGTAVGSLKTVSKPTIAVYSAGGNEFPIEDMRFGRIYITISTGQTSRYMWWYFVLKKIKDGKLFVSAGNRYEFHEVRDSSGKQTYLSEKEDGIGSTPRTLFDKCERLPDVRYIDSSDYSILYEKNIKRYYVYNKSTQRWNDSLTGISELDFDAKKYFVRSNKDVPILYSYLTSDNKLVTNGEDFPYGDLKDVWCYNKMAFALTENNELYAKGTNSYNQLGLPNTTTYNDWEKVGNFDVKRIEMSTNCSFLLTNDGKIYFAGNAISGVVSEAHSEFTQIYPEYIFKDIAYSPTGSTLIVTMEE